MMSALIAERNTIKIAEDAKMIYLPVAPGEIIYQGALVVINENGQAEPGKKAEKVIAVGRAEHTADNSKGSAGDVWINVQRGVFVWENDTTVANAIGQANILSNCYVLDDQTVTMLATETSLAGKVIGVTNEGVAVETL